MAEAAAVAPSVTSVAKKGSPVLMPERFSLAGQKQNVFVVDLPIGTSEEQMMDPAFWAHVSEQMNPTDEIKVRAEDGSAIYYLVVAWCERNFAKVVLDRKVDLIVSKEAPVSSIKHRVEWKGPHLKWCVIRNADNKFLREGDSKDGATRWLREYESAQAR